MHAVEYTVRVFSWIVGRTWHQAGTNCNPAAQTLKGHRVLTRTCTSWRSVRLLLLYEIKDAYLLTLRCCSDFTKMNYTLAAVAIVPKKETSGESEKGAAAFVKCQRFTLVWCICCHAEGQYCYSLWYRKDIGLMNGEELLLTHYSWASIPLASISFTVSAPVPNVYGTGRFPQLKDAIGQAEAKESSGWWIIISSIQKWGVMGTRATLFFVSPMRRENSERVIYNVIQGSRGT